PSIPTAPITLVTQPVTTPIRQYTRRVKNAQSSTLPTVADEPVSLMRDVSERKACPTESGFIADQDRATIANLQRQHFELLAKFQAQEMEILKLKDRVKVLEDREGIVATRSGDDAPIKGRSINEGEAATERISDDSEELARVLTSIDAATVLAGGIDFPTGSGSIPTTGPPVVDIHTGSDDVPTASLIVTTATVVTPYLRRKGKEVMVESDTLKKQRLQEQIDARVARELEEQQEREDKRMTEQIARDAEVSTEKTMDQKAEEGLLYDCDQKQLRVEGSKEEAERLKRKGFNLEQEKAKKQKTSEEVPDKEKSPEEILEEKIKEMM
nr:hypothetical protein [Tanacetum cinerariifolium]